MTPPPCPYCGGRMAATGKSVAPGGTYLDGPFEPDSFMCPACPGLYHGGDRDSLLFQRFLVRDLHTGYEENNRMAVQDARTNPPTWITAWEMFDRHAVALWFLHERN